MTTRAVAHRRFQGFIKESAYKRLRGRMATLMSYIDTVAPAFHQLNAVVSIFRFLQFVGPSLCAAHPDLWSGSDSSASIVGILSVLWHGVPPGPFFDAGPWINVGIAVVFALALVLSIWSAFRVEKTANLPGMLPVVFTIWINLFGFVLHPIVIEISFGFFGECIVKPDRQIILGAVASLAALTLAFLWCFIYCVIIAPTLLFRPTSLIMVAFEPNNLFFVGQAGVAAAIGFATYMPLIPRVICLLLAAAIYIALIKLTGYYGGFAQLVHSAAFRACCVSGCLMCLAQCMFAILDVHPTLPVLIVFIIGFMLITVVAHILRDHTRAARLTLLDSIIDQPDCMELKTINDFVNVTIEGFRVGHPVCMDWSIFKWAVERWPDHPTPWFVYAKFACIFPDQSATLSWIYRAVVQTKVKGSAIRTVKMQSLSIACQRETALSPELKASLRQFTRLLATTKQKLRRVWDLVIQGNTLDMDDATQVAFAAIDQCDASIRHIARQFPNNRFVTRQYARFAQDLLQDQKLANDMLEKSQMLQRGIPVTKDIAHEWGAYAFPNLPEVAVGQHITAGDPEAAEGSELGDSEVGPNEGADESDVIARHVKEIRFPGIRWAVIIQVVQFIVFFLVLFLFTVLYAEKLERLVFMTLQFFHDQALLRTQGYVIAGLTQQVVYTKMVRDDGLMVDPPPPTSSQAPMAMGGSWDLGDQLAYWVRRAAGTLQSMTGFSVYQGSSQYLARAQSLLFDSIHEFDYFGRDGVTTQHVSVAIGLIDILSQQDGLIQSPTLNASEVNGSAYLDTVQNIPKLGSILSDVVDQLIRYVQESFSNVKGIYIPGVYALAALGGVTYLVFMLLEIRWIRRDKEKVYGCLTALPKDNVSQISELLRVRKCDGEDSATQATTSDSRPSKQDDNIMKTFMAGGSRTLSGILDQAGLVVCIVLMGAIYVTIMIVLSYSIEDRTQRLTSSSPHVTSVLGAWSQVIAALTDFLQMTWLGSKYQNVHVNKSLLVWRFNRNLALFNEDYTRVRFGNLSAGSPPYFGYVQSATEANSKMTCADPNEIPRAFDEATRCYNPDMIYGMVEAFLQARVSVFSSNNSQRAIHWSIRVQQLWSLLIYPIWELLVAPMSGAMIETIGSEFEREGQHLLPLYVVLIILAFLCGVIGYISLKTMERQEQRVLGLLLHCPASVILQSSRVMAVLGGDFSLGKRDDTSERAGFFKQVVMQVPDAIVTVTMDSVLVERINVAAERLFGADLVGESFSDFLQSNFRGNIDALLQVDIGSRGHTEQLLYEKPGDSCYNLDSTVFPIGTIHVFSFRDVTQTVRYDTLIASERSKSEHLLRAILPPCLVPRVQAGERTISFAVASASIVFMDIVSFTPWCGATPAARVMMTLNNLFQKFDINCNKQPTMTRIKCIGDCYMAAGGVFSEINQPAEHAKQAVSFGLDSLESVRELDEEQNERLQMRVGINSGGPIIAGVLGGRIGKPTFEILGPAINMAQQMEHHGIPMQIQVSRAVYELIYGGNFLVRERGTIEVKGSTVVTYLVTGRETWD